MTVRAFDWFTLVRLSFLREEKERCAGLVGKNGFSVGHREKGLETSGGVRVRLLCRLLG